MSDCLEMGPYLSHTSKDRDCSKLEYDIYLMKIIWVIHLFNLVLDVFSVDTECLLNKKKTNIQFLNSYLGWS